MKEVRFAILGCGNGGQTMAADLARRGFRVVGLYDRFEEAVAPVRARGGVELVGEVIEGFVPLTNVTADLAATVVEADVVMVVVPAFAHAWLAEALAPHLRPHQAVLLHPGYFGGSILFRRVLLDRGAPAAVPVGETHSLIYATRIVGPGVVGVRGVKSWVQLAAFPATDTSRLLGLVGPAFPQFVPAQHVLETGLNNPNPIIHTLVYLLNLARIEQGQAPAAFDFRDWMTPGVERVHQAIDGERVALARRLGLEGLSYAELSRRSYEGRRRKIVGTRGAIPQSAESLPPRFIVEDVPMGLVPLASLGRLLDVPTPTIEGLIALASAARREDFWATGRTMEALGFAGWTAERLTEFVRTGRTVAASV